MGLMGTFNSYLFSSDNFLLPLGGLQVFQLTMAFPVCFFGQSHNSETSGQSYKHFTLINYDSRVVIWGIFQSGMTLES